MEENNMKPTAGEQQENQTSQAGGGGEVNTETQTAGNEERKPRELFYERIRTARPEAKYDEDEEEYFRSASELMDDMGKKGEEFDKMTQKIMGRFNSNPEEASAFLDYLDGMPLVAAIRKNMGDEALTIQEGEDGWEEYQKAGEERTNRMKEMQERVDTYSKNAQESETALEEFAKEAGMSDEEKEDFKNALFTLYEEFLSGKISKDALAGFKRSRDYDKDIASAREQGVIDGKNENIEIQKRRRAGSGLPDTNAGSEKEQEVKEKPSNPTADFLSKFNHR